MAGPPFACYQPACTVAVRGGKRAVAEQSQPGVCLSGADLESLVSTSRGFRSKPPLSAKLRLLATQATMREGLVSCDIDLRKLAPYLAVTSLLL